MIMEVVANFTRKNRIEYFISRDAHGKWYVANGSNEYVQTRLNASEIVRYLANALEGK